MGEVAGVFTERLLQVQQTAQKCSMCQDALIAHTCVYNYCEDGLCEKCWKSQRNPRTPNERQYFDKTLEHMYMLGLGCHVFASCDGQYQYRFWPCWEMWLAFRTISSEDGRLESASVGNSRIVFGFPYSMQQNEARGNQKQMRLMWGQYGISDAHLRLEKPDVCVTNLKDKSDQLAILKSLEEKVQQCYTKYQKQMAEECAARKIQSSWKQKQQKKKKSET